MQPPSRIDQSSRGRLPCRETSNACREPLQSPSSRTPSTTTGRAPGGTGQRQLPAHPAGAAVDADDASGVGRHVDHAAVERRGRPGAALAARAGGGQRHRPHERTPGPARVELHQLADLLRAALEPLQLARDVEEPFRVDHDGGVRVVSRPEAEHALRSLAAVQNATDVPALYEPGGVGEVRNAAMEGDGALDRERPRPGRGEQPPVPARDAQDDLRPNAHLAVTVVAAVQLDDVEPGVLAALEQVVADDQRGAVPVVVPDDPRHARVRVELPQHGRPAAVERDDPEQVVARAGVVERVAVGVGGGGSLGEIAGHQRLPHRRPRPGVEEVVAAVVGAEAELERAVPAGDHVGLPGPADAAPGCGTALVGGERAHAAAAGVAPEDPRRAPWHGPFAVVAAREVAAEGGQTRHLRVDRPDGGSRGDSHGGPSS